MFSPLKERFYFVCISICLPVDKYTTRVSSIPKGQKRAGDPLELELQAVLSSPVWVLETELGIH